VAPVNPEIANVEAAPPPATSATTVYANRRALRAAGIHRALQAGIVGTRAAGAESIVLSGGYEDDKDFGNMIIYTGHGGRDSRGL